MVLGIYVISNKGAGKQIEESGQVFEIDEHGRNSPSEVPSDLSLPFNISDIDGENGEINPIGVVRFSKDEGDVGHSGIDVPLFENSPIYAVSNGKIVVIQEAGDPWGGMGVIQLLKGTVDGEGWGFVYEHINLGDGLLEGDEVKRGEVIGSKAAPAGFTAHFQLSRLFNNYRFLSDIQCWPDFLSGNDNKNLLLWWDEYSKGQQLVNSWRTTKEDGKYPFRELLEVALYPDGPQMCYELGTDVR